MTFAIDLADQEGQHGVAENHLVLGVLRTKHFQKRLTHYDACSGFLVDANAAPCAVHIELTSAAEFTAACVGVSPTVRMVARGGAIFDLLNKGRPERRPMAHYEISD